MIIIGGWLLKNYINEYYGLVILICVFSLLLNIIVVWFVYEVGFGNVVSIVKWLGIFLDLKFNFLLLFGMFEVIFLEMVFVYVLFFNGGYGVLLYIIWCIKIVDG